MNQYSVDATGRVWLDPAGIWVLTVDCEARADRLQARLEDAETREAELAEALAAMVSGFYGNRDARDAAFQLAFAALAAEKGDKA